MRYVYVKHGSVVDQLRRVASSNKVDGSGPDAFISDFLAAYEQDHVLVLGQGERRESFVRGTVRAESFPAGRRRAFAGLRRGWSALLIGLQMLRWRPHRILCGCTDEMLWVATLVAKLLRVPIVNSRHGELQERLGVGGLVTALNKACIKACDAVICHGPFMADQIMALGVSRKKVYEFEVGLNDFAASGGASEAPEAVRDFARRFDVIVFFVGRVQWDKGILDLLDAFCGLPESAGVRVGLIYIGDGKDMSLLKHAIRERGVEGKVLVLGKVSHSQLPGILRRGKIVVAPTRPEFPEGRCMVVLESLVLGLPVVAPDFGPFPYAVQHGVNGLLFKPGDPQSLRECLVRLTHETATMENVRRGAAQAARQLLATRNSFAVAVGAAFDAHTERH